MAEENEDDKKSVSDTEVKAREAGHVSKEEWAEQGKDPAAWVDVGEFLRRGELLDRISRESKERKKLQKMVDKLVEHNSHIEKASYDRALKDLQAQKKVAASENDVAKVVELDEQIAEVKEKKAAAPVVAKDDAAEAFEQWKADNDWYEKDEDMFAYANGIGNKIESDHGPETDDPWSKEKILTEVAKRTKKAFEWKTKNLNREAPSKVGGAKSGEGTPKGSKLPTYNDLPKEAQETYREWVKTTKNPRGIMTGEEFLRQYAVKAGIVKEDNQ